MKIDGMTMLQKFAKIESLPKNVADSIPLRGFLNQGVIETSSGVFTKTYRIPDVNFNMASEDEQVVIANGFQQLLNSFDKKTRWQFTIFNHAKDKGSTLNDIKIAPQRDSLNKYRAEVNRIYMSAMQEGSASIAQDKYLTVAIDDVDAEHAVRVLNKMDIEIGQRFRDITGITATPLNTRERMQLLYDIYNQEMDYRMATGVFDDGSEEFSLEHLAKIGRSVKDIVGPNYFDFTPSSYFMQNDMYAEGLFLERIPTSMTTSYLSDLADIQCSMLISLTFETMDSDEANKMAVSRLASIEGRAAKISKDRLQDGYIGALPPELEAAQNSARALIDEITVNSQALFLITMSVVVFAPTKDKLEEYVRLIKSVSGKYQCPLKPLRSQQEFLYNTALPLCRNDINQDILHTTETSCIFIPFNTQELNQKNALFYGINQSSGSMIMYDRTTGDNFNGLVFGGSGSGKSFYCKFEMVQCLLKYQNVQLFVIDPQGEYDKFVAGMNGQEIKLAPGSPHCVNPLDIDLSEADDGDVDIIAQKIDYVITMFDIIDKERKLSPSSKTLIDKCLRRIYRPYVEELQSKNLTSDKNKCPTLTDLYQELRILGSENPEANHLAETLYQYTVGSFNCFAGRTNVETDARLVVYNIKALGDGSLKELGLYVCVNDVQNRMIRNSKKDTWTRFWIDEFHILLDSEGTTRYLKRVWKMCRKWMGVPTGITQNTEELLRTEDSRGIFNTTNFIIILKEEELDRQNLGQLLHLSESQLNYVATAQKGHGLLYNGKIIIPFGLTIPKDIELYEIMTTSHDTKKNATNK